MITSGKLSRTQYYGLVVAGLAFLVGIWWLVTALGLVKPFFLPSPITVVRAIISLVVVGNLTGDILDSLSRVLGGFLLACVVAIPLGILIALSKPAEALVEPFLGFVRYIPPSAFIPLAILWFGIGNIENMFVIFISVAPYLALLVVDVVVSTRRELVQAALTLGLSQKQVLTQVIIPSSLPGIWDAMRLMVGSAWTFVIIAEIVGASSGLGHIMIESQRFLRTDNIFASVVIVGLLGLATDYFFKLSYKVFFPWTEKSVR